MTPTTIETLKVITAVLAAFATVLGSLYIVITRPLLKVLDAHSAALDAKFDSFRIELKTEFAALRTEMKEMESRLNQRIDTYVVRKN